MAKLVQLTNSDTNENIYPQMSTKTLINADGSNFSTANGILKGDGTGNFTGVEELPVELVELSKDTIGLDQVDNTSDADKPISTATQTALDNKQSKITASGLLKGDGSGGVTAAVEGTDYIKDNLLNVNFMITNNRLSTTVSLADIYNAYMNKKRVLGSYSGKLYYLENPPMGVYHDKTSTGGTSYIDYTINFFSIDTSHNMIMRIQGQWESDTPASTASWVTSTATYSTTQITSSTDDPTVSDGSDGDVWLKYEE